MADTTPAATASHARTPRRFPVGAVFTTLLCLALSLPVPAKSAPKAEKPAPDALLRQALSDFGYLAASPFRMNARHTWQTLGFCGLVAGMVFTLDRPVNEEYGIEGHNHPLGIPGTLNAVGEIYDRSGPVVFTLGATGAMLTTALVLEDSKLLKTTGLMAEAVVFTRAFTAVFKQTLGRSRPYTQRGPRNFNFLDLTNPYENRSMPSGHASSVFAMMTVIAKQYNQWWVAVPAYTFAASVCFQRLNSRNHWLSDVVTGGVLGYLVGNTLVNRHAGPDADKTAFRPLVSSGRVGAEFQVRF